MTLTYTQITALTERTFLNKVADGVFRSKAVLARLNRPGFKQLKDGGHEILCPIINSKPGDPAAKYYDEYDTLDNDPTDDTTAAVFQWKQIYEPIRIGRKSMLINSGDAAKLSLIATKMQIAEKNIRDILSSGIFSDGTALTGALSTKQLTGIRAAISTTSTYGGIAVSDFAEWIAVSKTGSGVNRAASLPLLQTLEGSITEGDDRPTAFYMTQSVYDEFWSLYQPHQRIESTEMAKLGFSGVLQFNGKPMIVDSHMRANYVYGVNENYLFLAVHKDEDMRKETIERMETSNSMLMRLFWMGNVVCNNRRFQGELGDISIAS